MSGMFDTTHVKRARKTYACDWCGERIEIGEPYSRYMWREHGDAPQPVRLHPECLDVADNLERGETFMPGDNPRGGDCGWCGECAACAESRTRKQARRLLSLAESVKQRL